MIPNGDHRRRSGGWLVTELLVGLSLIGLILAALAAARYQARELHGLHLLKQRCVSAARAQIDSIAATGRALPDAEVRRLWPGVKVAVERAAGEGDWAGLTRVSVTASARRSDRAVRVVLGRYVAGKGGR